MVVDSTGAILGTLDESTGNVVNESGDIVGTLNETTGLVVDSAGALVGTVTNLVDGARSPTRRATSSVSSTGPREPWSMPPATWSGRWTR